MTQKYVKQNLKPSPLHQKVLFKFLLIEYGTLKVGFYVPNSCQEKYLIAEVDAYKGKTDEIF